MTLHWWMHWFWITAHIAVSMTSPALETMSTERAGLAAPTSPPDGSSTVRTQYTSDEPLARLQQSYRIAKAIGIQPLSSLTDAQSESLKLPETTDTPRGFQLVTAAPSSPDPHLLRSTQSPIGNRTSSEATENNRTVQVGKMAGKKEAKITWVQAFSKAPKPKFEEKTTMSASTMAPEELTVMPLQESRPMAPDPNAIRREQQLHSLNRSDDELLLGEDTLEPHVIATAASVLDAAGLGDSTRLGRARGTFAGEFQREQLLREEQHIESKEQTIKETAETSVNVTEIAAITGSCLAIIILLSTVGSLGFIMYRKKYLNPPQTLNSDKCSNPDSSGYIDDSTIRDNSEEMYSLDNDSFLNSLEAMTIQNYWTDSVKHTKL